MGQGSIKKNWDPLHIFATIEASNFKLVHNLGLGLAYQKQRFGPKLAGVLARGASKKNLGPPVYLVHVDTEWKLLWQNILVVPDDW